MHAVAGILGGLLSGIFSKPSLLKLMYGALGSYGPGLVYGIFTGGFRAGLKQIGLQVAGAAFITVWNAVVTSLVCIFTGRIVNLRMRKTLR